MYAEFYEAITGTPFTANLVVPMSELWPQIILGHRMWCVDHAKRERFLRLADLRYMTNSANKTLWLRLFVFVDDLSRMHLTHRDLLHESVLDAHFYEVDARERFGDREAVSFDEMTPTSYNGRPSDELRKLSAKHQSNIWSILVNSEPYRKLYLYLSPSGENRLPQLLSIYLVAFYLGSITRYRPRQFSELLESPYGSQVREFVDHQIVQFLYMIASHFEERDVAKPAVI